MATSSKEPAHKDLAPDQHKLGKIQARRLAALATNVKAEELENRSIAQLVDQLKWRIDPELFLFRRICGRVVKKDPQTGIEYPVPFATVYVEDTDCNLISYFPHGWNWGWHFPYWCHREVIGTTKTDKCGNFCVWVPRFDIDWILRWRHERICFPILFRRPSIGDLIDKNRVVGPWPPIPGPDPGPLAELTHLPAANLEAIAGANAGKLAQRLVRAQAALSAGAPNASSASLQHTRAFDHELPPPLPAEFHRALSGQQVVAAKTASAEDGVRAAVAAKLGLDDVKQIDGFSALRCIGPFWRCVDFYVPEWQRILDVPDITFRVTQDVNGDGTEETIYSEGYFDVRWDAGPLPDVTLVASHIAKESRICDTPIVPCGNAPAIRFAGFMELDGPTYFDATNGFALRPNRPSHTGVTPPDAPRGVAQTPFCWTLPLYGCVDLKNAQFYRVLQSADNGTTFSAVTGLAWNNYRAIGGGPIPITADANGWYEVNPHDAMMVVVPRNQLAFQSLILDWPTPSLGKTVLKLEIADGAKNVLASSPNVAIQSDNTAPTVVFSRLAWKFVGESDAALRNLLGIPCPTIHRGASPQDIEVVFEVNVAANHLRDASIGSSGCGGGSFVLQPGALTSHWHTTPADNSVFLHGRYRLDHAALEGAYTFGCSANSRAMNPSGADGGNLLPTDWFYDPIYIYSTPSINVAVVNEN
jgi:hypothetical protein